MSPNRSVVFDLGGVLIDWDPRHLYRRIFRGDDVAMEHFLAEVCSVEWNEEQDAGRSFAEGVALLQARHPGYRDEIAAFQLRWQEKPRASLSRPDFVAWCAKRLERCAPIHHWLVRELT